MLLAMTSRTAQFWRPHKKSPEAMLPGFSSPAMAPVVVPIIGSAVIGVRPISVAVIGRPVVTGSVVVVVITIARTVIAVRARRAGGECDFLLLSEIFADDLAIELFPMWPFEQQPELGFKPFTNRWQFGQHNGLPSCECRVDGPQNRPVQRHHQDFVRAARPTRRDRMFEVGETIDQMSGHERSHRQPDFGRPRAESFGIEVVKIYHHR